MKRVLGILSLVIAGLGVMNVQAGNPDRAGEAGAYELTLNPWARSSGIYGQNSSRVMGVEAMRINVAGLAFTNKTEVVFARTHWLQGSEVYFNSAGLAQKFGKDKSNVLGVSIMSISLGEIERTTTSSPEGGLGTYKPSFLNIGVAYSRAFSNSIYGGVLFRLVNERIDDLSATGFALDLGLQYVTGKLDNIRFGIALRNVGTPMKFRGDGLTFRGEAPDGDYQQSQSQRTEKFELPSMLNIGISYDLYADNIKNNEEENAFHRITLAANFTSNSFGKDRIGGGLEYSFKEMFSARVGYRWEDGITDMATRTNAHTGLAAGVSVDVPLKKNEDGEPGPRIGFDYSFRTTSPFKGTHTFGARFNL